MERELIKELANLQEKLRAIDKLSNIQQKITAREAKEVSYLIHQIIEADYLNSELARQITSWSLQANKDLFMSVKEIER